MSVTDAHRPLPAPRALLACLALLFACQANPELQIAPGKFIALQQDGETWWLTDAAGQRFVSLGINHIEPVLLAAEKHRAGWARRYGADLFGPDGHPDPRSAAARKWLADSIRRVRGWGFNTLGVHNPIPQQQMPYVAQFRPYVIDGWQGIAREYPDVFAPGTRARVTERARAFCAAHKDDPYVLGVSFNDMPIWRTPPRSRHHEWVETILALPASAPGKGRWIQHLQESGLKAAEAARLFNVPGETWGQLAAATRWSAAGDRAAKLGHTFLQQIARTWYPLMATAVRACDPHHLILGDKFEGQADLPGWLDPIIAGALDVVYFLWYDWAAEQLPRLRQLHRRTKLPILMGDSSFSVPTADVPRPKGVRLNSQENVGRAYAGYLRQILAEPYVIGWHFCGYMEGSLDLARYHLYYSYQNGLVNAAGVPYPGTVARVTAANARAQRWHSGTWAWLRKLSPARARAPRPPDAAGRPVALPPALRGARAWAAAVPPAAEGKAACAVEHQVEGMVVRVGERVLVINASQGGGDQVPRKPISFIKTDAGAIAVGAGLTADQARRSKALFGRLVPGLPLRYIVYTHDHGTDVLGAAALRDPGTKIVAHENLPLAFDRIRGQDRHHARLDAIQFNLPGEGQGKPPYLYPDLTFADHLPLTLGRTTLHLFHAEGETDDYAVAYLPEEGAVWVGDLAYDSVPMVASPMKPVRDELKWRRALERIKALRPRVLINSARLPVCGQERVARLLDRQIAFLAFLHEAVNRQLNARRTVEEAVQAIRLPQELADLPETYGTLAYAVRGLYHRYQGWFDRNGTHLEPAPRQELTRDFVEAMGGPQRVLARAAALIAERRYAVALEYLDLLIDGHGHKDALRLKGEALRSLAHRTHGMTQSMYLRLSRVALDQAAALPGAAPASQPSGEVVGSD